MEAHSADEDVPEAPDVGDVATRLSRLPEAAMRTATLAELVVRLPAENAAWILDALATAGRAGGPPYDLGLLAAVDLASRDLLPYDTRRAVYEAAERLGLESCRELFFSEANGDGVQEGADRPRPLTPGTKPLTLGERKALARSWRRDAIEKLVLDPSPDVIALLIDNPRVTEEDILRIATARRASAAALMMLLGHKRWNVRPRVRKALLRNPRFPEAAAVRLVGLLPRQDLEEMAVDPKLPIRVLAALHRRLRPRC